MKFLALRDDWVAIRVQGSGHDLAISVSARLARC